jgi:hypothetical protein
MNPRSRVLCGGLCSPPRTLRGIPRRSTYPSGARDPPGPHARPASGETRSPPPQHRSAGRPHARRVHRVSVDFRLILCGEVQGQPPALLRPTGCSRRDRWCEVDSRSFARRVCARGEHPGCFAKRQREFAFFKQVSCQVFGKASKHKMLGLKTRGNPICCGDPLDKLGRAL